MNKSLMSLVFLLSSQTAYAQPSAELIDMCNDCHGSAGVSENADVPTIAGFSETAITDLFIAYVDDMRPEVTSKYRHGDITRPETSMTKIAKDLSEEQIEELAIYYSELDFVSAKQSFNAELVAAGKNLHKKRCGKCHEDGGSSPDDDTGLLAGQWSDYLKSAFAEYKAGSRDSDEEMIKKINKLTDEQIESLISYYASLQ